MLPEKFKERMREMLGGEYEEFLAALRQENYHALRVNPLKGDVMRAREKLPFALRPVPWAAGGFYYDGSEQPGKHPLHEAGVYYIQEPSAMAPAVLLAPGPGERVLDLCAAPGGKSTQLASFMEGEGLLVCNEIHPARAKILSENMERMGIRNGIATNETPDRLAERFPGFFDRILVDAPCSGEGMFRKNEEACGEWSPEHVRLCADRQDGILNAAYAMLRPGGILCYSTCTFAPEENEGSVSRFLHTHPDMRVDKIPRPEGFAPGRPEWIANPAPGLEDTMRLWPHRIEGEGHFMALLRKEGGFLSAGGTERGEREERPERPGKAEGRVRRKGESGSLSAASPAFGEFAKQYLRGVPEGAFLRFGDQIYLTPAGMPSLAGLKVLRPGLHLGTEKKNRFEPSHALALALDPSDVRLVYRMTAESREAMAWLRGESLSADGEKGWYLICVDGFGIGWGKLAGGMMKNHYPRGLRRV